MITIIIINTKLSVLREGNFFSNQVLAVSFRVVAISHCQGKQSEFLKCF